MKLFRRRPTTVEAMRWEVDEGILEWLIAHNADFHIGGSHDMTIAGPHGWMVVRPGDWIVRGTQDWYPVDPVLFEAIYEPLVQTMPPAVF